MSDNLKERLDRLSVTLMEDGWPYASETVALAGERIKTLEAEHIEAVLQSLAHLGQAAEAYMAQLAAEAERDELQAKLDKAVGAFQNIVAIGRCDFEDIRVLLAELEDKSDE